MLSRDRCSDDGCIIGSAFLGSHPLGLLPTTLVHRALLGYPNMYFGARGMGLLAYSYFMATGRVTMEAARRIFLRPSTTSVPTTTRTGGAHLTSTHFHESFYAPFSAPVHGPFVRTPAVTPHCQPPIHCRHSWLPWKGSLDGNAGRVRSPRSILYLRFKVGCARGYAL